MIIKLDLPRPEISHAVNLYWLKTMFSEFPTKNWKVNVLTSAFVGLAQNAEAEYKQACLYAEDLYIHSRKGGGFNLGSMHMMARRFENVISNTHRSVRAFTKLRGHKEAPPEFRDYLNANRPAFSADAIADRIRDMRNAIHHLDEKIGKGEIEKGQPVHVRLDGFEVPVPDSDQPNQTLMTYDRISLGPDVIFLGELCDWINEMGRQAEYIAAYEEVPVALEQPPPQGAPVTEIVISFQA
ncbi:hypothetical protein J2W27_000344 [Variovorax boronicumulans]|uniref:hypothetical protein n=1 Tax=Variovorax boronicumulans TaxID=436515 RepID=UPI0027882AE1|nr:hypothetical protein [Variovorax boronicumulans]MDP9908251.1 hypothetical protein [Variovorax boronicumulans]